MMLSEWIRDMCDCESTKIDLTNDETIRVLKTIYNETKKLNPITIPPTDSSEEESEDDDYEPSSSPSSEEDDDESSDLELEEEPISITTNEEFIVKQTEQGFWYLW